MKNFKRQHILIIPLLQEAYSGRKGVGFGSQGAGAGTKYHGNYEVITIILINS